MTKLEKREARFLKSDGTPKYLRCYESRDDVFDKWTAIYTRQQDGRCFYIGMSEHPTWPNGFGQHGDELNMIDRPRYGHLGKKIKFTDLPKACQRLVMREYREMWGIAGVLLGFYNRHGYRLYHVETENDIYKAVNPKSRSVESLRTLRVYCIATGKKHAEARGMVWGGCQREDDDSGC